LITSFAAREVFVGTMATIYSVEGDDSHLESVREKMASARNPDTGITCIYYCRGLFADDVLRILNAMYQYYRSGLP
jgi:hypothetical protein